MLKKLTRLDILEIILVIIGIFIFIHFGDSNGQNFNEAFIFVACVSCIVWIEIFRAKSKKE